MFDYHHSSNTYFKFQYESTKAFIIPDILTKIDLNSQTKVMEIGCGEGGNLLCFAELGCQCVGVDMDVPKIEAGIQFFAETPYKEQVKLIADNIYNRESEYRAAFDVIILKDTIEHIHDQQKLISFMRLMLKPNGVIFFAFPPWYMPFGGHQQMMEKKKAGLIPYTHLLPGFLYPSFLKLMGEPNEKIEAFMEIKETGISIERFEGCLENAGLKIDLKKLYFINPNYQWKFGFKPRLVNSMLGKIPFLRNFYTTTAYFMVSSID